MAEKKTKASVQELDDCLETYQEELLAKQNVIGVCVAKKVSRGQVREELGLTALVAHKFEDPGQLRKEDRIPKDFHGVTTDVVETGEIFAGVGPVTEVPQTGPAVQETGTIELLRARVRPVEGGYSVGHFRITAGTYATAVYDLQDYPGIPRRYYVLSNNHVLANSNDARIGDPILQPGPFDGGTMSDRIARLSRFVRIDFAGGANFVDAAIAEGEFDTLDREIYWIGYPKGMAWPAVDDVVQKTGRTTSYTTGKVISINATVNVNYGGGRVARFVRQILTSNMSAGGDSGSLLLNEENQAVGLLFAGSATVTIHNPIQYVAHRLQIKIG